VLKLIVAKGALNEVDADVLVVSALQKSGLAGAAEQVDISLERALSRAIDEGAFKGVAHETEWVYPARGVYARRVLLVGAGKAEEYDLRTLRNLAGVASRQARRKGAKRLCLAITLPEGVTPERGAEAIVDGALVALSDSDLYKDRAEKVELEELQVWLDGGDIEQALRRGEKIAAAVNFGRWLGDEPANIMTTSRVAEEARKMASLHSGANGIECEVLDEGALRAAGMGSLLSVSAGTQSPPFVVVLTYNGGSGPKLGLVGKGVVFDTGGISIKPGADMHYMKYDMCGAAAVISTIQALAQVGSKANVIAIAGLVENMPGGRATRPGDVVRAANGKTIEIINTDAEGRLVLADALDLAIKRGAERLVDVATLTGAIKVALGDVVTGAMGKPQDWVDELLRASERAGERVWQMPLYSDYKEKLKSNIADMMNVGSRFGGAVIAGAFLQQFVGKTPWVHLDVAGTAWTEKDSAWQSKGATGAMIRTLVELAEAGAGA
jgi:leucyl aminopeptidase